MPKIREQQVVDEDIMSEATLTATFSPKNSAASGSGPSTPASG